MKVLLARRELCVACGACEEVCALTFFKVPDRERSAIRVTPPGGPWETEPELWDPDCTIEFCDQCGECIAVCPTQALFRSRDGIVRLRKRDCVGCLACVGFCPTLVMYVHPDDTLPFKCVACGKCVDECPADALLMAEAEIPAQITELTRSVRSGAGGTADGN